MATYPLAPSGTSSEGSPPSTHRTLLLLWLLTHWPHLEPLQKVAPHQHTEHCSCYGYLPTGPIWNLFRR
ncbi:hypothetical protein DPMN_072612 [Dreissena polymorpha]|uniref:Uncharacterized protein n=1 Tax=Dreissena polymorpha TaxID=45954 RepID=A0A9D4BXL8_DREPO|nr:hypothetical protein DPMN_072612 [Dreissena polymorpha]